MYKLSTLATVLVTMANAASLSDIYTNGETAETIGESITQENCAFREPSEDEVRRELVTDTCENFCNTNPFLVDKIFSGAGVTEQEVNKFKPIWECYTNCISCTNFDFVGEGASAVFMGTAVALTLAALF